MDLDTRLERLRGLMAEREVDAALFSAGPDLTYLSGYRVAPSERLTMLVVTPGAVPILHLPRLEAPRVAESPVEVVAWGEAEDPVSLVARRLGSARRIAIGDHAWSVFLLGLQERLPGREWLAGSQLTGELRMRKDQGEVAALRAAAEAVDRVVARIPDDVPFRGRTERQVARHISRLVEEEGHDESWPTIVASGPNGASPHHEAGDREIEEGDLVVCDLGGSRAGYFSDCTRTFSVGAPGGEQREVHRLVAEANRAAKAAVRPGVVCEEVDRAARAVIAGAGLGEHFVHRTGHGIGLEVHEHPYMVEGDQTRLEPGMTFSVEPGIYLPGRFGVRIEDIVACAADGVDDLNRCRRELVVVR